jgi:hypothetical protein
MHKTFYLSTALWKSKLDSLRPVSILSLIQYLQEDEYVANKSASAPSKHSQPSLTLASNGV